MNTAEIRAEIDRHFGDTSLDSVTMFAAMQELAGHAQMYANLLRDTVSTNCELYARFRDGDSEALDTLRKRHHARLVRRASEDVADRVFAKLATVAHKFDPAEHDVVGWMNWIADHAA